MLETSIAKNTIKLTTLTDSYTFTDWQEDNQDAILLFAIDSKNTIYWHNDGLEKLKTKGRYLVSVKK